MNVHTDAPRRRRRFNVGRVLVLNRPPEEEEEDEEEDEEEEEKEKEEEEKDKAKEEEEEEEEQEEEEEEEEEDEEEDEDEEEKEEEEKEKEEEEEEEEEEEIQRRWGACSQCPPCLAVQARDLRARRRLLPRQLKPLHLKVHPRHSGPVRI